MPFVLCPQGFSVIVFNQTSSNVSKSLLTLVFCRYTEHSFQGFEILQKQFSLYKCSLEGQRLRTIVSLFLSIKRSMEAKHIW